MQIFLIYGITAIISYIATIPPGPLSVFVAHTTLQKNSKIALWVALGGVLCESTYALLAIEGVQIFEEYPMLVFWMQRIIIVLLFAMGLFTFFQKSKAVQSEQVLLDTPFFSFIKGISLSLFNPALLPFWVVVLLSYQKYPFLAIDSQSAKIGFVLGAGTGTFLLVYTYAFIANRKRELIFNYITDSRLNKLIGCIFIGLAMLQLINLL
jgi:threonine/homoserine/homoserine lactone efflux protein